MLYATGTVQANVDNCLYYYIDTTATIWGGKAVCVICKYNYIGTFTDDANKFELASCAINTDTISSTFVPYQNLSPKFGKFLSVHTCSTAG